MTNFVLLYALTAALCSSLLEICWRSVMKDEGDAWSVAVLNSFIGGFLLLPFLSLSWTLPSAYGIGILLLSAAFWMVVELIDLSLFRELDAAVHSVLASLRLILLPIVGMWAFSESLSEINIAGIGCIAISCLMTIRREELVGSRALSLRVVGSLALVMATLLDRYLTTFVEVHLVVLSGYFLTGILMLPIRPKASPQIGPFLWKNLWVILASSLLLAVMGFCFITSLSVSLGKTIALVQFKTVLTFIFSVFLLKERARMWGRLSAAILTTMGAILAVW